MNADIKILLLYIMQLTSVTDHDVMCFLLQSFNNPMHFRQFEP